jgi:hypothetical protein
MAYDPTVNSYRQNPQHPIFSFDYSNHNNTSQIVDSLKNLVTRAENIGFDSF